MNYALVDRIGLAQFPEALVYTGEWLVSVGESLFMDLFAAPLHPPAPAYIAVAARDHAMLLREDPRDLDEQGLFILGGSENYAHWLLDTLPRLSLAPGVPDAGLLTDAALPTFARQSLAALSIPESRLRPMPFPDVVRVKNARFPSLRSLCGTQPSQLMLQPHAVEWLRRTFLPMVTPAKPTRRLFISRGDQPEANRRLVAERPAIDAASRLGFEVVTLDGVPFLDQVRLFAEAACVVGPHGAAFANMVFAPPTCALVELLGPRWHAQYLPTQFYTHLCRILGQRCLRVVGETIDPHLLDQRHLSTEKYRIREDKVFTALRDALTPR